MRCTCIFAVFMMGGWGWILSVLSNDVHGEEEGRKYMETLNSEAAKWANRLSLANWDYESNLTDHNLQQRLKLLSDFALWQIKMWHKTNEFGWKKFKDPDLRRQFMKFSGLGTSALPEEKRSRLDEVIAEMGKIYSTTKLNEWTGKEGDNQKSSKDPTITLEPELVTIFSSKINNTCEMQYYWKGWHETVGKKELDLFKEYITLMNEAAKLNNFTDNAAMWIGEFETDDFEKSIENLYEQIRPLFQQLHAYVRHKLSYLNTNDCIFFEKDGPLPAHILGNVWAQEWESLYDITVPYPGKASLDVTPAMVKNGYTVEKMYKTSEEFFTSLGLIPMTDTFWKKSIIEKPKDRDIVCHASAWDFSDGEDYRIKMCTTIKFEDLKTVHHEMGHIQYYQQYNKQPQVYREGANTGFHEAVGDTLALSVSTPKHLIKLGLIDSKTYVEDKENEINSLFFMALSKVAFLPFAYVLDKWRWEMFRGDVTPAEYNCRFWKLREDLQGVVPPVDRSSLDLDGAAKYHVIADISYIRYFVSFIIQFQFHKALCVKAGQYNPKDPAASPLHECDIYQNTDAGKLLSDMLQLGSSKHWKDALEAITGQREMDAKPLLEYFKPLMDWLVNENKRTGEQIGWTNTNKVDYCRSLSSRSKPVIEGVILVIALIQVNYLVFI